MKSISELLFFQKPIVYLDSVPSTNDFIKQFVSEKSINFPIIIFSEFQTNGRGQRGKGWISNAGQNLLFSLYVPCSGCHIGDLPVISQEFYMAIADALNASLSEDLIRIKWPNDFIILDKKVGGVLIETAIQHDQIDGIYLGLGLNVHQIDFPEDLKDASSLERLFPSRKFCRVELMKNLMRNFENIIERLEFHTLKLNVERYNKFLYKFKEEVVLRMNGAKLVCKNLGVTESGAWLLEKIDTQERFEVHSSSEVEFIYNPDSMNDRN